MLNESLFYIFFSLASGYAGGMIMSTSIKNFLLKIISPFILILLFSMGAEIGWVFIGSRVSIVEILNSALLAFMISFSIFVLLHKKNDGYKAENSFKVNDGNILQPIFGCLKVISAFALGIYFFYKTGLNHIHSNLNTETILYIVIFIVGVDLVNIKFNKIDFINLRVPIYVLLGSFIGCSFFSIFSKTTFIENILLSSGLGWFSLSGPMVSNMVSAEWVLKLF
jgi:uncharacterized membrane protein YbjE (DUF340 family)